MNRATTALVMASALTACATGGSTQPSTVPATIVTEVPSSDTSPFVTRPTSNDTTAASPAPPPTSSTTSTTTTTTTTTEPAPDMTCEPGGEWISTASGRRVLLRADDIVSPAPTVIVIHGFTGTPTGIERVSNMTEAARSAGIAVAYPEGSPVTGIDGALAWNTGAAALAATEADDVAALAEMIEALVATGCVDRDRLTITGESNGGAMVLTTICSSGFATAFRGAVMVIPAVDPGVLARCDDGLESATPLTAVAGRTDLTTPFDGNDQFLPQPDWFADVTARRGCGGLDAPVALTAFVDRIADANCSPCTELLTVADGPHTWPGTPIGNGGTTPGTFDLNRRIIANVLDDWSACISER